MNKVKNRHASRRNYVTLGEFLRKSRDSAGLTQLRVSRELGFSSAQLISDFECGIRMPSLKKIKPLAELYGLSIPELIEVTIESKRGILNKALKEK
ncbi:MAG: helix-turn-helix domain-containing protein [Bdellovibrionota bacterium]